MVSIFSTIEWQDYCSPAPGAWLYSEFRRPRPRSAARRSPNHKTVEAQHGGVQLNADPLQPVGVGEAVSAGVGQVFQHCQAKIRRECDVQPLEDHAFEELRGPLSRAA